MGEIKQFLVEVNEQLHQITWPTQEEIIRLTSVVLFVTIIASIVFGGIDLLLTKLMAVLTLWQ